MAIDTAAKRASVIGFGSPWVKVLPPPDGTIAAQDRSFLSSLYAFVTSGSVFSQTLSATITMTSSTIKAIGAIRAVTSSMTASTVKAVGSIRAVTASCTATVVKAVSKRISTTVTLTATRISGILYTLTLAASIAMSGVLTTVKSLASTVTAGIWYLSQRANTWFLKARSFVAQLPKR